MNIALRDEIILSIWNYCIIIYGVIFAVYFSGAKIKFMPF